ncbi:MAG: hypothetical protein A2V86_03120 [Deltaproteobacteria bacterium RBG_16_49_23]|nr:MAG: hypothetical protein A2V86_03120 [Deltaproteobacteria bacterium RBG_16_49_23]
MAEISSRPRDPLSLSIGDINTGACPSWVSPRGAIDKDEKLETFPAGMLSFLLLHPVRNNAPLLFGPAFGGIRF